MPEERATLIVRREAEEGEHGHHGGAWKVAYADFATAMMAFFLLLWLLSATNNDQRKGLADFFDETIPISPVSGGGTGILGGHDPFAPPERAGTEERGQRPERLDPVEDAGMGDDSRESAEFGGAPRSAGAEAARPEARQDALARALEAAGAELANGHVRVRIAPDGLVIELVDLVGEPLFAPGSAEPTPLLRDLVAAVAPVIATTSNRLAILGHTDATPFPPGSGLTNWELSAGRANAARRLMVEAGTPEARISHVAGYADTLPFADDPLAAENRRIAIKLVRDGALAAD